MAEREEDQLNNQAQQEEIPVLDGDVPSGIARLREEWVKLGLAPSSHEKQTVGLEPVIFPEPVGDYRVMVEEARTLTGLSEEAMDRLISSGELDSILVRFETGPKRMISQSSLARFLADAGMAPELSERLAVPSEEITSTLEEIRAQMQEMKETHARQLQQFKDILLLEIRNLKEQDRDLTSFIYDLTAGLEDLWPKLKKRKRTTPQDKHETQDQDPSSGGA